MIYFASDFHLGVPNGDLSRKREEHICRWLETIANDATEIYLLGDIFDFWFEYRYVVPKGYVRFLGTLAKLTDRGIKITMFKGNHDMWMFGYLKDECGVEIISDELVIKRGEKTFFLHHGDGLGMKNGTYNLLRKVFRNQLCQWMFARIHPNLGIGLAQHLSRGSRKAQHEKYKTYLGDDKEYLSRFCLDKLKSEHFDYFIFGHRHLVLDINLGDKSRYLNLGDWFHEMPYIQFDGLQLHMLNFSHQDRR